MIAEGSLIAVELVGGLMDGHQCAVTLKPQPFDMYLFQTDAGGRRFTLGYVFASRTTRGGKRWVLEFHTVVAAFVLTDGTSNTGGPQQS